MTNKLPIEFAEVLHEIMEPARFQHPLRTLLIMP